MYALILLDVSPKKIEDIAWFQLLENLEGYDPQKAKNAKIFGGAWLIDLNNGLSLFRNILDKAQENHLSFKVSLFENKPEFII
jgi:hypothetical protein